MEGREKEEGGSRGEGGEVRGVNSKSCKTSESTKPPPNRLEPQWMMVMTMMMMMMMMMVMMMIMFCNLFVVERDNASNILGGIPVIPFGNSEI